MLKDVTCYEKSRAKETRSASGEDTVLDREVILDVIEKEISKTWRKWLTQFFSERRVIKAEVTSRGKVQRWEDIWPVQGAARKPSSWRGKS